VRVRHTRGETMPPLPRTHDNNVCIRCNSVYKSRESLIFYVFYLYIYILYRRSVRLLCIARSSRKHGTLYVLYIYQSHLYVRVCVRVLFMCRWVRTCTGRLHDTAGGRRYIRADRRGGKRLLCAISIASGRRDSGKKERRKKSRRPLPRLCAGGGEDTR